MGFLSKVFKTIISIPKKTIKGFIGSVKGTLDGDPMAMVQLAGYVYGAYQGGQFLANTAAQQTAAIQGVSGTQLAQGAVGTGGYTSGTASFMASPTAAGGSLQAATQMAATQAAPNYMTLGAQASKVAQQSSYMGKVSTLGSVGKTQSFTDVFGWGGPKMKPSVSQNFYNSPQFKTGLVDAIKSQQDHFVPGPPSTKKSFFGGMRQQFSRGNLGGTARQYASNVGTGIKDFFVKDPKQWLKAAGIAASNRSAEYQNLMKEKGEERINYTEAYEKKYRDMANRYKALGNNAQARRYDHQAFNLRAVPPSFGPYLAYMSGRANQPFSFHQDYLRSAINTDYARSG